MVFNKKYLQIEPRILVEIFRIESPQPTDPKKEFKWYMKKLKVHWFFRGHLKRALEYKKIIK